MRTVASIEHDGLGAGGHVDRQPVALADAHAAQRGGDALDLGEQLEVGERAPVAALVEVDERGLVASAGRDVVVERVVREVRLRRPRTSGTTARRARTRCPTRGTTAARAPRAPTARRGLAAVLDPSVDDGVLQLHVSAHPHFDEGISAWSMPFGGTVRPRQDGERLTLRRSAAPCSAFSPASAPRRSPARRTRRSRDVVLGEPRAVEPLAHLGGGLAHVLVDRLGERRCIGVDVVGDRRQVGWRVAVCATAATAPQPS